MEIPIKTDERLVITEMNFASGIEETVKLVIMDQVS
jgi:hypothetical protein